MTTKFSNNSFISLVSYKKLNSIGRYVAIIAAVLFLALPQEMWAITYNATLTGSAGTGGSILLAISNSKPSSYDGTKLSIAASSSGGDCVFYAWAIPNVGYYWSSWSTTNGKGAMTLATPKTNTAQSITCTAGQTSNADESSGRNYYVYDSRVRTNNYTITANFAKITLTAPSDVTFTPTNAQTSCGDYTGTLTFTASHSCAKADFNDPVVTKNSGNGVLTVTGWEVDGTQVKVNYKFTGNNTYGGNDHNRANSFTVTLTTKADESASCNVTADFPNVAISDGNAEKVYPSTPSVDVAGSAVFPVTYSDGAGDFTATITGATGGTWTQGTISFASTNAATGAGNITVPFTFNAGGATGDFSATLTLTATNGGGATKTLTLTAYAEPEADYDVEVYNASGTKISDNTTTWADGLTLANSNAGSTIKLMRNIDLGTLTATQSVTNNITLDLNGKTLSGTISSSYPRLLYMNSANKTLTIMDSKTGGKLSATGSYANALYCIQINNGNVILESGTIEIENTNTSQTTADRLYATAVYVNSGKSFTMNGGVVKGTRNARDAYGIYGASSATAQSEITINNGAVYAYGKTYAYGIRSYGVVNIHNGTIHAEATGTSYAYGVFLRASANATASSGYYGKLNMDGGLVEAVSKTTYAYGVFADRHRAGTGAATAVDGTHSNQETGLLNITGGTIKGLPTTTYGYGVSVYGDFSSKDNKHITHIIKNATIEATGNSSVYGVQALAEVNGTYGTCHKADVELTNCNITANAKTAGTAYAVYGGSAQSTVFENLQPDYFGEYATAAKITINSGTYTADVVTSGAYAICTATRARSMYNSATSIYANRTLGGEKTGYPELIIHDGTFTATTHTLNGDRHARAVSSGGNTTINGGTFTATSEGRYARCIYGVAGKLVVNNATIIATANGRYKTDNNASEAAGVFVDAIIQTPTGFTDYCEAEVNNCDITAITKRGTGAYGVYINCTSRPFTALYLRKDSLDNKWTHKDDGSGSYDIYKYIYPSGDRSVAAKCKINGGKIMARTDSLSSAYGVCMAGPTWGHYGGSFAQCELVIKNTDITVTSHTETACGIQTAGPADVDNVSIQATATTTKSYGILCQYPQTTVTNSTFEIKAPNTVYGAYVNASVTSNTSATTSDLPEGKVTIIPKYNYAQIKEGELILNAGNVFVDSAKVGNTAYAVYVHAAKADWTASATYLNATGSYAYAGKATINGGKYTATASGTTAYAAGVADPVLQGEATATPTLIINDGKFKGTATSTYADVSVNGEPGYFVLNGGYYVLDENLDKKLGVGMNKVAVKSGTTEYTEGYRYRVTKDMTGEAVCKITQNSTSYASLEEALQVVNASPSSTWTIVMLANATLSKGDYEIPANTTLLIPYKSGQTTINGTTPAWVNKNASPTPTTPSPYLKLTFASGVNMTVKGKIEASSTTYINQNNWTGIVGGPYGWLQLNEDSHIDLESGAYLFAWGYVTGKGSINAKNGSFIYEDFQMGDWRGGTIESAIQGNTNGLGSKGVFLLTDYYFQNVECPITYRPGAQSIAYSGCYMEKSSVTVDGKSDPVTMVGTSGSMFLMNPATAGEDTWVRKEYDAEKDQLVWTLNSGASIGSFSLKIPLQVLFLNYDINLVTSDYVLPMATNFKIVANEGDINVTNDVCFLPGSEAIVNKEANLVVATGKRVFVYDQDDWSSYGGYYHKVGYSPSWKACPRTATKLPDAKIEIAGTLTVDGSIYTTAGGGNIFSTRENSGKIKFNAAAPASTDAIAQFTGTKNTTLCQVIGYSSDAVQYVGKALTSAKLKNEDGEYTPTTGASTGDIYAYMEDPADGVYRWLSVKDNGCFTEIKGADTKQYIHPSDFVAVEENANGDHAYHNLASTRMFVNAEAVSTNASCVWWEVDPTPEVIDDTTYYVANNENFDNYGTYYYWDNTTSYWKPKKVTVTWNDKDGNKITNGTFGDSYNFNTSPQFFGTNPTWANTATEKHDWIGWRDAEGNIYDKNATLPRATNNVTYTAYFETSKYQYTITFKNKALPDGDGKVIWSGLMDATTTEPAVCPVEPTQEPTISTVYEFDYWEGYQGSNLPAVTAAATYTAVYKSSTRQYHVTFYNYDAVTVLYETDVDYNTSPAYGGVTPFRANTSAFSYEWTGWKQGATTYGTSATLPVVTGNISYTATFEQTELKYQVLFKRQDGSIIDAPFFTYEETPSAFPANPTMASTVSTDYTFREWSPAELVPVTEDGKVYTALFDESPRQYTAHFENYNGTSLNADQTIDYNTVPAYTGTEPIKPNDSRNSYEFSGWAWAAGDGWEAGSIGVGEAFPAIKGDITFTAQYTPTLLQFDVIYQREDGTVILRDKKKWGESSAFPTSGLNYEDATYTYTFDHWSPATVVNPVTTNATYTAYYNQSIKTYSITAVGISPAGYGSVSPASLSGIPGGSTVTVNGNKLTVNGTTITATPTAADAQYTYTFDSWNNVPATVTGNVDNIEAVFTRTVNTYTVTWKNADGTVLDTDENVEYGITPTYNGETPTKVADADGVYTFSTWTPAVGAISGNTTYTATYSTAPTVASVTVSGNTTYYASVADAITFANGKTDAVVTILQDDAVESEITISAAMTIDLNGKTISSTNTTSIGVFKISASGKTVTIRDSGTNGKISRIASSTVYMSVINLVAGSLNIEGGTIYAENTYSTSASANRACGIYDKSSNTNSVVMSAGTIEAKRAGTYAYGMYLYNTKCGLTVTGGEIKASGTGSVRGIYTRGTATLSNATITATTTGTGNCYTLLSDNSGKFTINSGTYSAVATGTATEVYAIYASNASVSATVNGGLFSGKSKELAKTAGTFTLKGGYYVHSTDLEANCATNYHVLPLTGEDPYMYEVAEAYTVTFDANGHGTAPSAQIVKKDDKVTDPTAPTADGYTFGGWYKEDACTNAWNFETETVTTNTTLYAKWESTETGFYADIVDVNNTAKTLTLNVSGWAANDWPYYINGTQYARDKNRAADRTMSVPYEGEPGDNYAIIVRKTSAEGEVVSKHTYVIPQAVTSPTELSADQTKSLYVKGTTLTVNANTVAKNIYVAPDAKLVVNSGKTLTADTIFLRTTPAGAAELVNNGTIATTTKVFYTRIILDKSGYFQFGLPLSSEITLEEIRLSDGANPKYATSSGWILRYYDESSRAEKGVGDNWKTLNGTASVAAGKGYEMYSGVNYYREFYFPVDLTALTNKVAVSYTAGSQTVNNGWNVIVSPLTSTYTNDPAPEGMTVSWMQLDGTFEQEPMTTIAPAKTFAYQTSKNGYISFASSVAAEVAPAPRRRVPAAEEPERIQWIHLDILNADGEGDQTSIYSHPMRYEQTYKTGIDVAKQSLTASRAIIYSSHAYGEMAFAGVADSLLESGVALTVYSPATQELTFSLRDNDWLNRMAYVWLIDNETGAKTDLLSSDYSYEAAEGTTRGRFFIQGQFKAPNVATDLQNGQSDQVQSTKARKLMINQKIFIEINGRLYDATGKEVKR